MYRRPRVLFLLQQKLGWYTYATQLSRVLEGRQDFDHKVIEVPHFRWMALPYKRQHMVPREKLYRHLDPIDGYHGPLGKEMRAVIDTYDPDVVHFSAQYPAGAMHLRPGGPVFTTTLDSTRPNMERQTGGNFWNKRDYKREAKLLHSAARLFPWSHWAGNSLVEDYGIPKSQFDVIIQPIDPSVIGAPKPRNPCALPKVAFIGNDFVRKGGDLLYNWVKGPLAGRCELHIMSRDPDTKGLGGPNVVVHGNVPHAELMGELLPSMDLLCHPTQSDMSAYVVIEAAFAGLPSVASAIGGIPELIVDGETGWSLNPKDQSGFIRILGMLLDNPDMIAAVGAKARSHAEQHFNADINFNRMFDQQIELARSRIAQTA